MPRKKKETGLLDGVKAYSGDRSMSRNQRIAQFLMWTAEHFPKQYCPHNVAVQAIEGYKNVPSINSKEVKMFKSGLCAANQILHKKYGRALDTEPGVGIRATVDDADTASVALPKRVGRFRAAKNALANTVGLVDVANIPDTPEMKPWKTWFKTSVKDIMKMVNSPEFEQKLLPPVREPESTE